MNETVGTSNLKCLTLDTARGDVGLWGSAGEVRNGELPAAEGRPALAPVAFDREYNRGQVVQAIENMRSAARLGIQRLGIAEPHEHTAIIVGGGPSISRHVLELRKRGKEGFIFALNDMHQWLVERGIQPNGCVLFEIDADPYKTLQRPHPGVIYFVCSHCRPETFEALRGHQQCIWHCWNDTEEYRSAIAEIFPGEYMLGGGITTFSRTLHIAVILGFRKIELFGCDSSFEDGGGHVQGYATTGGDQPIEVWVGRGGDDLRKFSTYGYLVEQAEIFRSFVLENPGVDIKVWGDGMLRYIHEGLRPEVYHKGEGNGTCS